MWEPNLLPDSKVSTRSSGKRCPGGTGTAADGVRQEKANSYPPVASKVLMARAIAWELGTWH